MDDQDTIVAISTAPGEAAIAVARLSGPQATAIADQVFRGSPRPSQAESHRALHGRLVDPDSGGGVDEVVLTTFRAPRSYTGEDVVEISCHGGWIVPRRVLESLLRCGARLALPGEFTQRAFLAGRMDLAQAEAVADLIRAKTDRAREAALSQLQGALSLEVSALREGTLDLLAQAEVALEFPEEEGVPPPDRTAWRSRLRALQEKVTGLLSTFREGKFLREGARVAIAGKPNVGKSSIFNALIKQDRAIVTAIPGTTRDVIESWVSFGGLPVLLSDTAGIMEPRDDVEREGVRRTKASIAEADLVLFVLDSSADMETEDWMIAKGMRSASTVAVLNKFDLPSRLSEDEIRERTAIQAVVVTSALQGTGLEDLQAEIQRVLAVKSKGKGNALVTNLRHAQALSHVKDDLSRAEEALNKDFSEEFIALELREALNALGELIGETTTEELLTKIFSCFCIGK